VASNLLSHGWTLSIGEISGREVDFIAEKDGKKMYIQVAYIISSPETKEREITPLRLIDDNWEKYIVSLDGDSEENIDGIKWV
jgi:uncharacterized protein